VNPNASSGNDASSYNPNAEQEAMSAYTTGQAAFERGLYRDSMDWFKKALTLISAQSALGGEIQMWLVTAYDAAGQGEEAIALCRQLSTHANLETRQKSKRLLFVLEAPKLQSKPEWLTQIPDLDPPNASTRRYSAVGQPGQSSKAKTNEPKSITEDPFEPIDPKESRGFLGIALGLSGVILLGLWWLSQISGQISG
jgi:tetratricopeptide (TPR) repeat protein